MKFAQTWWKTIHYSDFHQITIHQLTNYYSSSWKSDSNDRMAWMELNLLHSFEIWKSWLHLNFVQLARYSTTLNQVIVGPNLTVIFLDASFKDRSVWWQKLSQKLVLLTYEKIVERSTVAKMWLGELRVIKVKVSSKFTKN